MSPLAVRSAHPKPPRASVPRRFSRESGLIGRRQELDTVAAVVKHARAGRAAY